MIRKDDIEMLITFEGIEGSGKTTQLVRAAEFLNKKGRTCVTTREPGGTDIGDQIRAVLLAPQNKAIDPTTEMLLYMADRVQHVRQFIEPQIHLGKVVLCDRFFDATVVYQGLARGIPLTLIYQLHELILQGLRPDLTILLDLPPALGLARAWQQINSGDRTAAETRFEEENRAFHEKVRSGYLKLAHNEPERFRVVDASSEANEVTEAVCSHLSTALDVIS
jgi:dTMP kinase